MLLAQEKVTWRGHLPIRLDLRHYIARVDLTATMKITALELFSFSLTDSREGAYSTNRLDTLNCSFVPVPNYSRIVSHQ